MQATESRYPDDLTVVIAKRGLVLVRKVLASEMCPVVLVITDVLGHQSLRMSLIEHNDMIEQASTAASDETSATPFCDGLRKLVRFDLTPKLLIVFRTS
jgi:hypothetical protein